MRYLDSSTRTEDQSLGHWIEKETATSVAHLRLQTGYFSINGLGAFTNIISALVNADLPITAVIGSNERDTTQSDIENLINLVGCPRANASVCIVSYSGGLFHPKVAHITRTDGSQFAYVGSANLTPSGVGAGNIEAGVLLDTNDGDPSSILDDVASRIDGWFSTGALGASVVTTNADVQKCVDDGILGTIKPTRKSAQPTGSTTSTSPKPSLSPLKTYKAIVTGGATSSSAGSATTASPASPTSSTTSTSAALANPSSAGQDVLIAEIGAGTRWKQANFPIGIMQKYFGVNPTAHDHIQLHEVDAAGAVIDVANTQVVNVKSQNYRIELPAAAGLSYPSNGRPIGVFRKIAPKEFRYRLFLPKDPDHTLLDAYLTANYSGPKRQLKRVVTDHSAIQSVWPRCPV